MCVQELLYADDSALVAQSLEDMQAIMLDRFVAAYLWRLALLLQHQQNRGTLPACPWHSTQGS